MTRSRYRRYDEEVLSTFDADEDYDGYDLDNEHDDDDEENGDRDSESPFPSGHGSQRRRYVDDSVFDTSDDDEDEDDDWEGDDEEDTGYGRDSVDQRRRRHDDDDSERPLSAIDDYEIRSHDLEPIGTATPIVPSVDSGQRPANQSRSRSSSHGSGSQAYRPESGSRRSSWQGWSSGHGSRDGEGRMGTIAGAVALAALLMGVGFGAGVLSGIELPSDKATIELGNAIGSAVIEEDELEEILVVYSYGGECYPLTVRSVMDSVGHVDDFKTKDGKYEVPPLEDIADVVRNAVIVRVTAERGIAVTDEDINAYVKDSYGLETIDELAQAMNTDPDSVRRQLHDRVAADRLMKEQLGRGYGTVPIKPESAISGNTDPQAMDPWYAVYILKLAGDDWDSEKGEWADKDCDLAKTLSGYQFDGTTASYEMANRAYEVSLRNYKRTAEYVEQRWVNFLNDLMSHVDMHVKTVGIGD